MRRRTFASLIFWTSLGEKVFSASQVPVFVVGRVQADGMIIPFGVYDGRTWSNPWPRAEEQLDSDILIPEDVPGAWWGNLQMEPDGWRLFREDGTQKRLRLLEVDQIPFHCQTIWALRSDCGVKELSPHVSPADKLGIAVSGGIRPGRIVSLKGGAEYRKIAGLVAAEFELREETAIREFIADRETKERIQEDQLGFGHPLDPAQRRKIPLNRSGIFRQNPADAGKTIYYIEAERAYDNPAAASCRGYSRMCGWSRLTEEGRLTFLKSEFNLGDCDGQRFLSRTPLGFFRLNGNTYWLAEELGYESESYQILEIGETDVVCVEETSGGC